MVQRGPAAPCPAAVSGWRTLDAAGSGGDAGALSPPAGSSKFARILRFVEQHDISGTCSASAPASVAAVQERWHHSYDEEAEEDDVAPAAPSAAAHEAEQLAAAAAAVAAHPYGPSCSVAFLYPAEAAAASAAPAVAAPRTIGSVAYFLEKPVELSWDEEAEGSPEAAAAEAAALRSALLARMHERRREGRAAARARRATLRAAPTDLEWMAPWVDDAAAAKAAKAAKGAAGCVSPTAYPHLQAFLAARTGAFDAVEAAFGALQRERGLQARLNQPFVYTWDEEAHGCATSSM